MLVLREKVRRARGKAAALEEAQRSAIDENAVAVARQKAMGQIPVGDVVAWILEDTWLEEGRSKIDPALVDEQSLARPGP